MFPNKFIVVSDTDRIGSSKAVSNLNSDLVYLERNGTNNFWKKFADAKLFLRCIHVSTICM